MCLSYQFNVYGTSLISHYFQKNNYLAAETDIEMSHFNDYRQLQDAFVGEEVNWCLKNYKESSTKHAIWEAESQSEALRVKAHRGMAIPDASLNKSFIQLLAQKLLSYPHQPHFTAEVSTMDLPISGNLTQNVPLKIWDIYGNRLTIVVGYVIM